jgi:outer membrane protein assembly factor BamB
MRGYCPTHQSRSPFVGAQTGAIRWKFQAASAVSTSPIVAADGTIYFGSNDHSIYAVDAAGQKKWSFVTQGNVNPPAGAIGADGTLYFGSDDHLLYALTPAGQLKWSFDLGGEDIASPLVLSGGTIFVGANGVDEFYGIAGDGGLLWRTRVDGITASAAAGPDGLVYVGSSTGALLGITPDAGMQHVAIATDAGAADTPTTTPDVVYAGLGTELAAFSPGTGVTLWKLQLAGAVGPPAIGPDGTIYVGVAMPPATNGPPFYAVTPKGVVAWKFQASGNTDNQPAVGADGTIYFGCLDGNTYALRPDGTLLWKVTTGAAVVSSPAIGADGTVYFGSNDGFLYAVGP